MHDIRAIRENPQVYVAGWSSRGMTGDDARGLVARIEELDKELRHAQTTGQDALAKRNAASKLIGAAMGRKDMAEADRLKAEVEALKGEMASQAEAEAKAGGELREVGFHLIGFADPREVILARVFGPRQRAAPPAIR